VCLLLIAVLALSVTAKKSVEAVAEAENSVELAEVADKVARGAEGTAKEALRELLTKVIYEKGLSIQQLVQFADSRGIRTPDGGRLTLEDFQAVLDDAGIEGEAPYAGNSLEDALEQEGEDLIADLKTVSNFVAQAETAESDSISADERAYNSLTSLSVDSIESDLDSADAQGIETSDLRSLLESAVGDDDEDSDDDDKYNEEEEEADEEEGYEEEEVEEAEEIAF